MKIMNLEHLILKSLSKLKDFNPEDIIKELAMNNYLSTEVGARDIKDKVSVGNYCFFPGFIELLKPRQIIELGSAMGVAIISMLHSQHKDFNLYGVTLSENNLEFCYVKKDKYPNFHPIVGDYMDMSIWKDIDLKQTDLWYLDGLHEETHLRAELELYKPFFKKGAIVLFDDMMINAGMHRVYDDLENIFPVKEKILNNQLHSTGFTIVEIGEK